MQFVAASWFDYLFFSGELIQRRNTGTGSTEPGTNTAKVRIRKQFPLKICDDYYNNDMYTNMRPCVTESLKKPMNLWV